MVESEGLSPEQRNSAEKHALVNANLHKGKADTGAVMSKILGEYPDLRGEPKRLAKLVGAIVREVNSMSSSDQVALLESRFPDAIPQRRKEPEVHRLPPLPAAVKGKAVFRLPPEPSGFMHIGHAMAFTVNSLYKDMYDGELWLRFEDTNPRKVLQRYYDSFREGIDWLGITCDQEKTIWRRCTNSANE
jgi:glutamyl-tRNA synthetase